MHAENSSREKGSWRRPGAHIMIAVVVRKEIQKYLGVGMVGIEGAPKLGTGNSP